MNKKKFCITKKKYERYERHGDGGQKVQTPNYMISPGDVMYSMLTVVNNTVLYI